MSSRAPARDLLDETRGRASDGVVRQDPSLALGMTNAGSHAMPTERGFLRGLGGLLLPLGSRTEHAGGAASPLRTSACSAVNCFLPPGTTMPDGCSSGRFPGIPR